MDCYVAFLNANQISPMAFIAFDYLISHHYSLKKHFIATRAMNVTFALFFFRVSHAFSYKPLFLFYVNHNKFSPLDAITSR